MYVYLHSEQANDVYTGNNVMDFRVDLPRTISNSYGSLRVAVVELYAVRHFRLEGLFLLTIDVVSPSPCHGSEQSVGAYFMVESQKKSAGEPVVVDRVELPTQRVYHRIDHSVVRSLRIQIKILELAQDSRIQIPRGEHFDKVYLVLHFKA